MSKGILGEGGKDRRLSKGILDARHPAMVSLAKASSKRTMGFVKSRELVKGLSRQGGIIGRSG